MNKQYMTAPDGQKIDDKRIHEASDRQTRPEWQPSTERLNCTLMPNARRILTKSILSPLFACLSVKLFAKYHVLFLRFIQASCEELPPSLPPPRLYVYWENDTWHLLSCFIEHFLFDLYIPDFLKLNIGSGGGAECTVCEFPVQKPQLVLNSGVKGSEYSQWFTLSEFISWLRGGPVVSYRTSRWPVTHGKPRRDQ